MAIRYPIVVLTFLLFTIPAASGKRTRYLAYASKDSSDRGRDLASIHAVSLLESNSSMVAGTTLRCDGSLECIVAFLENIIDMIQKHVVSNMLPQEDYRLSPTKICMMLGDACKDKSDLTIKAMSCLWNLVVIARMYTGSWELYFGLFPSGWKKLYTMFVQDPKYAPVYLLSYRYAVFGSAYSNKLNSLLHAYVDKVAVIPATEAFGIVQTALEFALGRAGSAVPIGVDMSFENGPKFAAAAMQMLEANAATIKHLVLHTSTETTVTSLQKLAAPPPPGVLDADAAKLIMESPGMRYNTDLTELNREYADFVIHLEERLTALARQLSNEAREHGKKMPARHRVEAIKQFIQSEGHGCQDACKERVAPLEKGTHKRTCLCESSCGRSILESQPWCRVNPHESYCGRGAGVHFYTSGSYYYAYCANGRKKKACDTGLGYDMSCDSA